MQYIICNLNTWINIFVCSFITELILKCLRKINVTFFKTSFRGEGMKLNFAFIFDVKMYEACFLNHNFYRLVSYVIG